MSDLFKKHNAKIFDGRTLLGTFVQIPIVLGLYSVIQKGIGVGGRFLWMKDLAKPDFFLALIVGVLTCIVTLLTPNLSQEHKKLFVLIPTIISVIFLLNVASGMGLYWSATNFVAIIEKLILRFSLKRIL
jgi:membrane protein insertase Oxa1/YidC/SpoIIIJ